MVKKNLNEAGISWRIFDGPHTKWRPSSWQQQPIDE